MPLTIYIPKMELWDEARARIIHIKEQTLTLEYSLVALSKWEARHHKIFLSPEEKTEEEKLDFIYCMIYNENVKSEIVYAFTEKDFRDIEHYIITSQSAAIIPEEKTNEPKSNELLSSDLIYYYLAQMQVPYIPTQDWHLSRVLAMIRIGSFKNKPEKKLSKQEAISQVESINERNKRLFEEMRRKKEGK